MESLCVGFKPTEKLMSKQLKIEKHLQGTNRVALELVLQWMLRFRCCTVNEDSRGYMVCGSAMGAKGNSLSAVG